MATGAELKKLSKARLRTVKVLMDGKDWEGAAYMMGYVLETLLKSASCKALRLNQYPDDYNKHDKKITNFFMNHVFDQLLYISGLSDIFTPTSSNTIAYYHWSQFTSMYLGDWIKMRYDPNLIQ